MRQKIRFWLINLANKIGGQEYYQFGEEITGMLEHKKKLIVCTKTQMYSFDGKKFKLLK